MSSGTAHGRDERGARGGSGCRERVKTDEGMTAFLEGMGTPAEAMTDNMERNDSAALAAALAGAADWTASPDKIGGPSLWYVGSEDNGGFSPEAVATASRLGVETHVIPGADHVASFRRTDDVLAFVRPFLDRYRS